MCIDGARTSYGAIAAVVLLSLAACSQSEAETLAFKCTQTAGDNSSDMSITYEGAEQGTLTVKAASGDMTLPATKETREGTDEDGKSYSVVGITASGETMSLMPDKAAIESCVKGKLSPDQLADEDIAYTAALGCAASTPLGKEPIKINGYVEIALIDPPVAQVFITKTFLEPSSLPGGKLKIDSLPPPSCELQQ
jgi:hypothetical protein